MVVAHPDDETMWGAGICIRETVHVIICCSIPRTDPIRAWKFYTACERLGTVGRILPAVETAASEPLAGLDTIDLSGFDTVITHNQHGEYGHRHHMHVHAWVMQNAKRVITFGYSDFKEGAHEFKLNYAEYDQKLWALKSYDHELPYDTGIVPKWEALLHRYGKVQGWNLSRETYDVHERTVPAI